MFRLITYNNNIPKEFDGKVDFQWLPEKVSFPIRNANENVFLELRLGYPINDKDKSIFVTGDIIENRRVTLPLKKGWNSYFIRLKPQCAGIVLLQFSKSLSVENDQRYLGAMFSYAALTDDVERICKIEEVNTSIESAVSLLNTFSSRDEWAQALKDIVRTKSEQFYAKNALAHSQIGNIPTDFDRLLVQNKREIFFGNYIRDNSLVVDIGCGKGIQ